MKNFKKIMGIVAFSFIILFLCSVDTQAASEGDSCWGNFSNIACTDKNGCNAQNVYQYCKFYANFWNPNGNLKLRTASVTIKRNGTVVTSDTRSSSDSNHYFNWCNIEFCLDTAGTYTVERKVTCLNGNVLNFDTKSLTVYPVSQCGGTLSLSSSSVNLNMTSNKSSTITATVGGIMPVKRTLAWSCTNTDVISLNWGSWNGDSAPLTITGKTGGSAVVTIYFKETSSGSVITQKSFNVTVGPNYTIYYNANGGSGAPSSQTKYYGQTLTLSSTKPTRSGYIFKGWATYSGASSASYAAGGYYYSNSGTTLYAVWEPESYTIYYNANGGSGAPSPQTKYYGQTLTLSSTKPTRSGHIFKGWATYSGASSASYAAGGYYYSNSGTTLYAVWEKESVKEDTTKKDDTKKDDSSKDTGKKDDTKKDDSNKNTGNKPDTKENSVLKKQPIAVYDKTVVYKSPSFSLPKPGKGMGRRTYSSNNKKVAVVDATGKVMPKECGTAIITIKAEKTAIYQAAEKKIKITVVPKAVKLKKVTPLGNRRLKAVWTKTSSADGYNVYISLSRNFSHHTREKYFKKNVTTAPWKELEKKKSYYVKVRTYKKVKGTKIYSAWSQVKTAKVK